MSAESPDRSSIDMAFEKFYTSWARAHMSRRGELDVRSESVGRRVNEPRQGWSDVSKLNDNLFRW